MARKEKDTLDLECILTDPETLKYSRELAENLSRLNQLDAREESFKTQLKADRAEVELKVASYSEKIKAGKEYRQVECQIVYDWKAGKRYWYRNDTGEQVRESKISEEDLQEHLKLNPPEQVADQPEEEPSLEKALAGTAGPN
jgi:hypothetical protein